MERYLIEHCSPTLASLKTANLFNYTFCSEDELEKHLEGLAATLEPKGVSITILRKKVRSALIYVYREKKLRTDLNHPNACKILRRNGYADTSVDAALAHSQAAAKARNSRMKSGCFWATRLTMSQVTF